MPDFVLKHWRAWTPGLNLSHQMLIDSDCLPVPDAVPKMLQRRLTPLAKAVFNVAAPCIADGKSLPVVFSSAHGEICKSLAMLQTIQRGQELSPTAFSLSVHNAIAGLFSIAFKNSFEITVIAPGQEGIAPAFIEALGMLHEGSDDVLVLLYDEPIADFYPIAPFNLNAAYACVIGLRITLNGKGLRLQLNRSTKTENDGEQPAQLLHFVRFLLGTDKSLHLANQGHSWSWQKC